MYQQSVYLIGDLVVQEEGSPQANSCSFYNVDKHLMSDKTCMASLLAKEVLYNE